MKKNIKILLCVLSLIFIAISCTKTAHWVDIYTGHFIDGYSDYDEIALQITPSGNIAVEAVSPYYLCGWFTTHQTHDTIDIHKDLYDSISAIRGDTAYKKRKIKFGNTNMIESTPIVNFVSDIISISLKSGQDFDENHAAGASLDDIVNLFSTTFIPYIRNGYRQQYEWTDEIYDYFYAIEYNRDYYGYKDDFNTWHYSPVYSSLSDITASDIEGLQLYRFSTDFQLTFNLDTPLCYLVFTQAPTLAQTHNLTVTITLSDGRVFEKTITKSWE
jgi:hypothetical protein